MTEAEQLARKKRLRAGHRASTTRILGQVEPAIAADPLDVSKINQLKRSLEDKLQSLSDLDQGILELTPEDSIETEIVQADEIRERLYAALSKLDLCLSPTIPHGRAHTTDQPITDPHAVDPPATDPSATDPPAADPPATHPPAADPPAADPPDPAASGTTRGPKVKLPKISLPRFNGNPVKWTPFWDSFQSAIHLNPELSDVDKFSYLRSLLDSTAYNAIAGLSLKSLGIEATSYGALLTPVLGKLPPELRLIVSRKVCDSNLDMDTLLATFEEELTVRERANPQSTRQTQERVHNTASTLFSSSLDSNPECSYCQQFHSPTSYSSVISRS